MVNDILQLANDDRQLVQVALGQAIVAPYRQARNMPAFAQLHNTLQGVYTLSMSLQLVLTSLTRPSPVAVHNHLQALLYQLTNSTLQLASLELQLDTPRIQRAACNEQLDTYTGCSITTQCTSGQLHTATC